MPDREGLPRIGGDLPFDARLSRLFEPALRSVRSWPIGMSSLSLSEGAWRIAGGREIDGSPHGSAAGRVPSAVGSECGGVHGEVEREHAVPVAVRCGGAGRVAR